MSSEKYCGVVPGAVVTTAIMFTFNFKLFICHMHNYRDAGVGNEIPVFRISFLSPNNTQTIRTKQNHTSKMRKVNLRHRQNSAKVKI